MKTTRHNIFALFSFFFYCLAIDKVSQFFVAIDSLPLWRFAIFLRAAAAFISVLHASWCSACAMCVYNIARKLYHLYFAFHFKILFTHDLLFTFDLNINRKFMLPFLCIFVSLFFLSSCSWINCQFFLLLFAKNEKRCGRMALFFL